MKALSFYQPFAWLISNSLLDSDERTWYCNYRGPLAIHASKKNYPNVYEHIKYDLNIDIPDIDKLEYGGFVAITNMIGCVKKDNSFFFLFEDTIQIPFQPFRGKPGLFDLEQDTIELLNRFKNN